MRIRITRLPPERERANLEIDVSRYQVGQIYDVGHQVAGYLLLMGFAQLEMRASDRLPDDDEAV